MSIGSTQSPVICTSTVTCPEAPVLGHDRDPPHRQWTLGRIVSNVIGAGLVLEQLHEYPRPFWDQFPHIPPEALRRLPHAFALLARTP